MPKYWGWPSVMVKEGQIPFNPLPHVQHITKTHIITTEKLPNYGKLSEDEEKGLINDLRTELEDSIVFELNGTR